MYTREGLKIDTIELTLIYNRGNEQLLGYVTIRNLLAPFLTRETKTWDWLAFKAYRSLILVPQKQKSCLKKRDSFFALWRLLFI